MGGQYRDLAEKLAAAKDSKFGYAIETLAALCHVLELKSTLGVELRAAYQDGNKDELAHLAHDVIPEIIERTQSFLTIFRRQWYKENKTFGFSTQDVRIGGLCERLSAVALHIDLYLSGEVAKIEELEATPIPFLPEADGKYLIVNRYSWAVSGGIV